MIMSSKNFFYRNNKISRLKILYSKFDNMKYIDFYLIIDLN